MSIPPRTSGEAYAVLMEHLRKAQEASSTLMHLYRAEGDASGKVLSSGWFHISENLKKMQFIVTELAKGKWQ